MPIWNPPSLQDAIENGEAFPEIKTKIVLGTRLQNPNTTKIKYRCDCKIYCWPFELIDCRTIPFIPNDFICSGCKSKLMAGNADIDGTGRVIIPLSVKPNKAHRYIKAKLKKKFVKILGAPQKILDKY